MIAFLLSATFRGFVLKGEGGGISETQFFHSFNLGHIREEGGGQKPEIPNLLPKVYLNPEN